VSGSGQVRYQLGDRLVDRYLEFVAGRCRPNTVRAVAFDLNTFFAVVGKDPTEVTAADVFDFLAHQRGDRSVIRLADRESGLSARTIARRLSSVSGLYAYLVARGDTPVRRGPARFGREDGCGTRRRLRYMWNGDRGRLPVGPAVQILLIVLALAGCAALGAAVGSSAALQEAGYQNAGVNISTGSGQPAGGMVQVSYRRGPSGNDQQDAQDAELIIWHTLRYRFGGLVIVKTAGGCAGLVCVSESGVVARATYAQLAARFGPRPRGLDVTSGTSPIGFPG